MADIANIVADAVLAVLVGAHVSDEAKEVSDKVEEAKEETKKAAAASGANAVAALLELEREDIRQRILLFNAKAEKFGVNKFELDTPPPPPPPPAPPDLDPLPF